MSAIKRLTDLEHWFRELKTADFRLFHGKNNVNQGNRIRSYDGQSVDEAWEELERLIKMNDAGDGYLTVYVPTSGKNVGDRVTFAYENARSGGVAGIGGFGGIGGLTAERYVDEKISDKMKIFELEQDLKKVKEDQAGVWGIIGERLAGHPALPDVVLGVINVLAAKLMNLGGAPAQPATVSLSGFPGQAATQAEERIKKVFPQFPDTDTFLNNLADFIEKNPGMAQMLFQSISQQPQPRHEQQSDEETIVD